MRNRFSPWFSALSGNSALTALRLAVLALAVLALAGTPLWAAEGQTGHEELPELVIPPNPFDKDGSQHAMAAAKGSDHLQCLSRKALAAATCKAEGDFNFVRQVNQVFVFSAFFGAADSLFYSDASSETSLVLSGKAWGAKRITASLGRDPKSGCAQASVPKSLCGTAATVRCCQEP